MEEKAWTFELVFEKGQMRVRLIEGRSRSKPFVQRAKEWLITYGSWFVGGGVVVSYLHSLGY